jgi:fimbrial chaperone protein
MAGAQTPFLIAAALTLLGAMATTPARADAVLEVAPVLLDIQAPSATGTVSVKNDNARPTTIQVRLFRWRQGDGEERYEPTQDVVASPPIADVAPGATLTIRVIRTAQTPVEGEESYRLVLDQLPESDRSGRAKVAMLLRQVLPVFFAQGDRSAPQVTWSVGRGPKGYVLRAHNAGDQRLRVAQVTLTGAGQAPIKLGGGLLGYVLGHADMSWTIGKARAFRPGALTVRGESDHGEFRATASVTSSR